MSSLPIETKGNQSSFPLTFGIPSPICSFVFLFLLASLYLCFIEKILSTAVCALISPGLKIVSFICFPWNEYSASSLSTDYSALTVLTFVFPITVKLLCQNDQWSPFYQIWSILLHPILLDISELWAVFSLACLSSLGFCDISLSWFSFYYSAFFSVTFT